METFCLFYIYHKWISHNKKNEYQFEKKNNSGTLAQSFQKNTLLFHLFSLRISKFKLAWDLQLHCLFKTSSARKLLPLMIQTCHFMLTLEQPCHPSSAQMHMFSGKAVKLFKTQAIISWSRALQLNTSFRFQL